MICTTEAARDGQFDVHRSRKRLRVSLIIPTLNECQSIVSTLECLKCSGADEIWVADGMSTDGTAELAETCGELHVVRVSGGRGRQQNVAAAKSCGEILLFLHADCHIEPIALEEIRQFVAANPRCPGGCLRMRVDDGHWAFRFIEAGGHLRAGVLGVPYGDQGMFVARWAFDAVGGFPELRLMDDLFFALRIRQLGRWGLLSGRILTSPRRWRRNGILRQTLWNWWLTVLAAIGVSPDRLLAFYPPVR